MNWLVLSLITLVLWGVWSLLVKVTTRFIDWKQYLIISTIGFTSITLVLYLYFKPEINVHQIGFYYALFAGILGILPVITFYLALTSGRASIVVPLTALYPVVTIILAFLLFQEKITLTQGLGITLALLSIILIST